MDFTKIGPKGQDLPKTAKKWQVIRDDKTGIYYATVEMPKRGDEAACEKFCADLDLLDSKWRLATMPETLATVEWDRFGPAIDKAAFPDAKSNWYRTATPYAPAPANRWCVVFNHGLAYELHSYDTAFARAVRAGQ